METRLAHQVHRVATVVLAEAAVRPSVPLGALEGLRDFVVAMLRHHHEAEDDDLWLRIVAAAPDTEHELGALSEEHKRMDAALDRLSVVNLSGEEAESSVGELTGTGRGATGLGDGAMTDGARAALRDAAVALRDTVHEHLAHEEPILFAALRDHVSPAEWRDFAQRVGATLPPVVGHLMGGFLDKEGAVAEPELVLAGLQAKREPAIPGGTG